MLLSCEIGLSTQMSESRRADSNRLPLLQLRVIIQVLQGFAQTCKPRIGKPVSCLGLAPCCTVLRSRWCQSGVKRCQGFGRLRSRVSLRLSLTYATLSKRCCVTAPTKR
jgi:hypothetical protein